MAKPTFNKLIATVSAALVAAAVGAGPAQAFSLSLAAPLGGTSDRLAQNFVPAPGRSLDASATITPAEAARRAVNERGGKVLSVSLKRNGAAPFYKVKLIRQGTVEVVSIPASK